MDMDFLEFLLAFGLLTCVVQGIEDSPCAEFKRKSNINNCLENIRQNAEDKSLFWFGDAYTRNCTETLLADCFNPRPTHTDSLMSRVLQKGPFDRDALDRFIEVRFIQSSGSYFGCDNDFEKNDAGEITVDPLSMTSYTPWQLRLSPQYTWDHSKDELFTLIFYDVGYMYIKSFIVNIPGANVSLGEVILPYEGPMNPTRNQNPYLFMLLKQSGYIRLGPDWHYTLYHRSSSFDLSDFKIKFNLTGPVALNWIKVRGDEYAAERKMVTGYMNTCPHFIGEALKGHDLEFLPQRERSRRHDLSVFINVTFTASPLTFNSCCTVYEYPGATLTLNPLGNGEIKAVYARSGVVPIVTFSMATAFPNTLRDFKDKLLTFMVLDGDVPYPQFGDKFEPFLHWMVVNIRHGDITTGQTVAPWVGPAPPDPKPHTYHYLLFEQPYDLNPGEMAAYASTNCTILFEGRCRYKSRSVISNHHLVLVGATWHKTANDEYVRYLYTSLGMRSCDVCGGVDGFSVPCGLSQSSMERPSIYTVSTFLIVALLGLF